MKKMANERGEGGQVDGKMRARENTKCRRAGGQDNDGRDNNKAPNQGIVSTDRSIKRLLYWIQHPDQLSSRIQVILRPDIEPE